MVGKCLEADVEAMRRQYSEARLGQIFAFVIAMAFIAVGGLVIDRGHPISGTLIGGAGVSGIVTAFILGRTKRDSKQEATPGQQPRPDANQTD